MAEVSVLLLNPEVVTPDGEWEAWYYASWRPGASRYRSFAELMIEELEMFRKVRAELWPLEDRPRPTVTGD
jgi:hypothetical protein